MPDPANAAVCLCSHGANYHADWRARVSVLNDGQIGRTHQAEQNVGAFVNASVENPEALSQGLKEGGSETEAQQGLDAAGGNAASRDEQLDFGQLPNDSGPVASKQSLPEGEGELQNCVGHRVGMEAGSRDREGVSEAVEESDSRKETTGLDSHWVELTLKANEPTQKRQALGAQEDPQGMGNIEVPDPPTATRKRPSVSKHSNAL